MTSPYEYDLTAVTDARLRRLGQKPEDSLADHLAYDEPDEDGEWALHCPLHDDENASASVNFEKGAGLGLWHCFAGCGGGDVGELLWLMDGAYEVPERIGGSPPKKGGKPLPSRGAIAGMHVHLMDFEWRLDMLRKRGLTDETLKEYGIGLESGEFGRFVIPVYDAKGEPVNLRYYRPGGDPKYMNHPDHGRPARLWPLSKFLDDMDDVVLFVEGEWDCALLRQHGFSALTTTGGAAGLGSCFKELTDVVRDRGVRTVYIVPDRDEPGLAGAQELAKRMRGAGLDVRVVALPYDVAEKGGKDVTDFFADGWDADDLRALMAEADAGDGAAEVEDGPESVPAAPGVPVGYVVPEPWEMDAEGIYGLVKDVPVRFAHAPIYIVERWKDDDGGEALMVMWPRDGEWVRNVYERDVVLIAHKIGPRLAADGAPVGGSNSSKVANFLQDSEAANLGVIPIRRMTRRLGWFGETFVANLEDTEVGFNGAEGTDDLARSFRRGGTEQGWREAVAVLASHPRAALGIYAALAAPLLRVLDAPSFTMDWAGETSLGKTTTLNVAASVWGDPNLVRSWDTTINALEQIAGTLCGLPLLLDDTKVARHGVVRDAIYEVSQGRGRDRAARNGGVRETAKWSTVLLSTGEQSITDFTQDGGTRGRVVSVWGSPFEARDHRLVRTLSRNVSDHYGHAGPRFIAEVLARRDDWPRWRKRYQKVRDDLSDLSQNPVVQRRAALVAVLKVAAGLAEKFGLLDWQPPRSFWESLLTSGAGAEDDDQPRIALGEAWEWANTHLERFNSLATDDRVVWASGKRAGPLGWAGRWDTPTDELCWVRDVLKSVLRERGHDPESVVKVWGDRGWLRQSGGKNTPTVRLESGGNPFRAFVISREAVAWLVSGGPEALPVPLEEGQFPGEVRREGDE